MKSKGHGLPIKRAKEKHWTERIEDLIKQASDVGQSCKRGSEWQSHVIEAFDNLLVDSMERKNRFVERTARISERKRLLSAVEKGVTYLRDIRYVDGGALK